MDEIREWIDRVPPDVAQQLTVLAKVALAGFLGGLIGWERERANKPAGLRTHMIVAAAACLLMGVGQGLIASFNEPGLQTNIRTDPIRVIQAIVIGVSFLGAGTIFSDRRGGQVEGLTTAAAILLTTAIGITTAIGQFILAIGATILTLIVLIGVHKLEKGVSAYRKSRKKPPPDG